MANIEKFGNFETALGADGLPLELQRSSDEVVFVAFDTRRKRLVELHVIHSAASLRASERQALYERITAARETANGSFKMILDIGEDEGVPYYSASLDDGEFLDEYILRRGALQPPAAFSLLLPLLDDLITLQKAPGVIAAVSLTRLQISLLEDTFLHLRALDYGFPAQDASNDPSEYGGRIVRECCSALFLMLTGRVSTGEDCDRYPALTGLPTGLRSTVRASLAMPENAPTSVERLREDVRDALGAMTRDLGQRALRRHLIAADSMVPESALRRILLHNISLEQILKGRSLVDESSAQIRYPFTIPASDARTEAPVTVHLLPPKRIIAAGHYNVVPLQMWRFNAEKHPNILRCLSVWESPDLTFLTEERGTGFPLSRLIANRVYLNPPEVLLLMRQVKRGIDQAQDCGVDRLDIHPSNIELRLAGMPHARELDKLMQKRLDAWPKFHVMLRPHMTMRSLFEPLMLDVAGAEDAEDNQSKRDFHNRSYVALTAYLLSGKKQALRPISFPDSVPDDLAVYVQEMLARSRSAGSAPAIADFLSELEKRTITSEVEQEGGISLPARGSLSRPSVATGPLESAGAVSDFDEDFTSDSLSDMGGSSGRTKAAKDSFLEVATIKIRSHAPKGSVAVWLWAAGVGVLILLLFNMFMGGGRHGKTEADTDAPSAQKDGGKPIGKTPVEIRKAQLLSEQEKEEIRTERETAEKNRNNSAGNEDLEPPLALTEKSDGAAQP